MSLNVNNVHQDKALTNVSINFDASAAGFVAEQVCDVVNVKNESDKYYIWDRANIFRRENNTYWADGARANSVTHDVTTSTYNAIAYGLEMQITDREKNNADSVLSLRKNKLKYVQNNVMLDQEYRVATLMTTQANYASTNRTQLTTTSQWNNAAFSGSIEGDIDTAKEAVRKAIGVYPNVIIIPAAVAMVMKKDAQIRELIKYTQNTLLVNGDLPETMFNMKVVIPGAINTTSAEGAATDTFADVWGKHVVLTYMPGGSSIDTPSHAKIFRAKNWTVDTWRDAATNSEWIRPYVIQDEVITSNVSGYLIEDCIA